MVYALKKSHGSNCEYTVAPMLKSEYANVLKVPCWMQVAMLTFDQAGLQFALLDAGGHAHI